MLNALRIAFSTLTLFPVSPKTWKETEVKASVAFYPLVGALLGGLLALLAQIHLSHDLKSLLLLLFWVIATAAFHLDGLSDCLDGFFGGANPEERKRIMKDPSIGAYGVTGILLALLFKYVLISHLLSGEESWRWLILIPLAARWAVTLACTVFKAPPGDKGLGSQVVGLSAPFFASATVFTLVLGFGLLKVPALEAILLAAALSLAAGFFSQSRIQGLTGDGMGATIELTEIGLLFLACLLPGKGFLSL